MILRTTGNPFHQHDCTTCVYLGSVTIECPDKNGREDFDLYVHSDGRESTVIARFGTDGNYHSGTEFGRIAFDKLPEMVYAGQGAMAAAYALAKINGWQLS